jgi:hypothetical protein
MASITHFQQHYATLRDEDLIQIALTRELVPEAQHAITEELERRGIRDLSSYKVQMDQESAAEEEQRQQKIAHRSKTSGWLTNFSYVFGLAALLYGIFRAIVPRATAPGDDIMIVVGLAIIVFGWLRSKLAKLWVENVLYRKPPR